MQNGHTCAAGNAVLDCLRAANQLKDARHRLPSAERAGSPTATPVTQGAHTRTRVHTHMHARTRARARAHTPTRTHTHTHTHSCIQAGSCTRQVGPTKVWPYKGSHPLGTCPGRGRPHRSPGTPGRACRCGRAPPGPRCSAAGRRGPGPAQKTPNAQSLALHGSGCLNPALHCGVVLPANSVGVGRVLCSLCRPCSMGCILYADSWSRVLCSLGLSQCGGWEPVPDQDDHALWQVVSVRAQTDRASVPHRPRV